MRKLEAQIEALSLEVTNSADRIRMEEDRNSELLSELEASEKACRAAQMGLANARREIDAARGAAQLAANARDEAVAEAASLAETLQRLEQRAEDLTNETAMRAREFDSAAADAGDLRQWLEETRTDLAGRESALAEMGAENKALKDTLDKLTSQYEQLKMQLRTLHQQKKEAEERALSLTRELTNARFDAATRETVTHRHNLADSGLARSQADP
jgi:chromosome segregation ATPase